MNKLLKELVQISYGKDYKSNPTGDKYPIYGTGGIMGHTSKALNFGPAVLSGRKGSINNPIYVEGGFWNVDTIYCLKPLANTDPKWLFYNLLNTDLSKLNEATGVPSVSTKALNKLEFRYFEGPIQRKIAEILNTVDAVIDKTEAAIAKYKALKQGMMQDLFTRGIDLRTGKLRPSRKEVPELYKQTELGWIPKEWEVKKLSEFGQFKNGINKDKESFGYGIPFVNIKDAFTEIINLNSLGKVNASDAEIRMYKLETEDIIFVRSSVKPSGVGYNTIYSGSQFPVLYSGFTIRYRIFDKKKFNPNFYNYYFREEVFRKRLLSRSTVSANTNINQESLKVIPAVSLSPAEQKIIINKINNLDLVIQKEHANLSKQQNLKKGLMQDLLTGKVEVEV